MGYLFLSAALAGGVLKAYCGKRISGSIHTAADSVVLNFMRMIFCVIISFFIAFLSAGNINVFKVNFSVIFLALLSGISSALFVITWLICVKSDAYVFVEVFIMTGTFIPLVGCSLLFNERILAVQWLGFLIVLCGIAFLSSHNSHIKSKPTVKSLLLLIAVALTSGVSDFAQKLFGYYGNKESNAVFNFYSFLFSALSIFLMMLFRRVNISNIKVRFKSSVVYIILMSSGLFINSFFKIEAARYIDAVNLYPLNQGAALFLGTIMAAVFFKEKITFKCVAGLILGLTGICIINLN